MGTVEVNFDFEDKYAFSLLVLELSNVFFFSFPSAFPKS
jgi:hypothetical protein